MVKINGEALAVAGKTLAEYLAGTDYNPKRIAVDRKSTRLNSSHLTGSRMPSSA